MKKDFQHLLVIFEMNGLFFIYDPLRHYLDFYRVEAASFEEIATQWKQFHSIEITTCSKTLKRTFFNPIFTCVGQVLYFIGLKIKAYTPYQLYKKLSNLGIEDFEYFGIESMTVRLAEKEVCDG